MSLNFNNTEIENVAFNGTELDKIYFNGTLVFEKNKPIYKRRIMIGDNLKDKIVYSDYPVNYWQQLTNLTDYNNYNIIGIQNKSLGIYLMVDPYVENDEGICSYWINTTNISNIYDIYGYNSDTKEEFNENEILINSQEDLIVSEIATSNIKETDMSYRHIYIEDLNIRPIQIGDNLRNATIYFTIPDNADFIIECDYFITATTDGNIVNNVGDNFILAIASSNFEARRRYN